jgi:putative tryptophan/tyrosine transport system substrate-binding protein
MRRREFISFLGGAAAWPIAAGAQQRPGVPVVGWLSSRTASTDAHVLPAFHRALNGQGFVEGRNLSVEYRYTDSQLDRLHALVADLVGRRAAVIVAVGDGGPTIRAVRAASATTPIVGFAGGDPIKEGVATSLNRPGGNFTGVIGFQTQTGLVAKRLTLLHDLLPQATRIAVLANPAYYEQQVTDVQDAARALGLKTSSHHAATDSEIDVVFATLAQLRPDALFITPSPFFFSRLDRLVTSATRLALPTSFPRREFVVAGGLMSYASITTDSYRVLGEYVGRLLKGEKAGELPIQQPTGLELVLNLKTAKALGINVPQTLLLLADEVIE